MSPLARKLLTLFGVLGLGASSAATYVHYNLIRNPDYSSFCDINATVSCKAAYLSRYGSIAGVPVAVGGVIFFAWVLLMLWGSAGKSRIKDSAPAYLFAGSTLALAFVLYLAYASFFILKEVCPLCVATYVAVIGVFIVSGGASSVPMSSLPKRILTDMRVLVATPLALVITLVFLASAGWSVSVFPHEAERPVVPLAPPINQDQRSELEKWWELQPVKANFPFSNDGAKVMIVEFADFQCPHCKQMYFGYKAILDKYLASNPKDVKFVFKTWPLNNNCNASVPSVHFAASCEASSAYIMAKPKGTADKLKDWFFTHQEELSPATVRRAAADVGGIKDFDAQYSKTIQEVKTDAAIGSALGVDSTPSFFVNGKRIPGGGMAPQYFDALIELELKRAPK
ncbi:MAG TPA: vitamin K epoxide reductase family protein [Vicinamibacterales bacterium]|nr:vitamin K epoxide reductase family protein [Vicinamibacterales bacterium]